ncbi:hypothetical protein niasHT_029963 [Heterodera trifolii]|uniref:Protein kinase domain-containing protein n=1 Tax=Heterodera trifolii TaxID=157864 RepID=A0ABD2JVM1_9BILA
MRTLVEFHQVGIHLDFKPQNVIVVESIEKVKSFKLIDFDASIVYLDKHKKGKRKKGFLHYTDRFAAPELFKAMSSNDPFVEVTPKMDIWPAGITIFQMAFSKVRHFYSPFHKKVAVELFCCAKLKPDEELLSRIKILKLQEVNGQVGSEEWWKTYWQMIGDILTVWHEMPEIVFLSKNMLSIEPEKRMSAQEVIDYLDGKCKPTEYEKKAEKIALFGDVSAEKLREMMEMEGPGRFRTAVFVRAFSYGRFRTGVFVRPFSYGRFRTGVVFMNQQKVIKTKRNNEKLEHDGALYVLHKFSDDGLKKFWRCEFHGPSDKCKGRLHTDLHNVVQKVVGVHSCDMNAAHVECQRLVTGLKQRAAVTFSEQKRHQKVIQRLRRDEDAPLAEPLNLEQLVIPNAFRIYKRTEIDEEQFLLADTGVFQIHGQSGPQRIIIFGRASTADWTHEMKDIYADGTFALTPPLFSQIYVFLAKRDGWVFPICYCLLTSKCTAIYTRMLQLLLERWPNFAPQTISLDFELAMVGAVRTVLPACSVRYCFFHLVRNMKKQIRALGLTRVYNTDPIFAEKSKMITSLAFLPVHHIREGLNALQPQLPAQLHGVFNWFLDNYTGKPWFNGAMTVPKFDPNEWSVHQRTLDGADRTNNFAEAFHRRLKHQFGCTHPTIWRFIDKIRCVQKVIDAEISRCVMGEAAPQKKKKYREADLRILRLVHRYNDNNNNIVAQNDHNYANANVNPENLNHFLAGISRNYEMRP